MSDKITPYKNSTDGKKKQVAQMFDSISGTYDGLNRVISWGSDIKWRKFVVEKVAELRPQKVLDVATGTGDLAIALTEIDGVKVVGLDISEGMLTVGREKIAKKQLSNRVELILGDSENLPFADNYFDAVTVAFGVRNFENLEKGLSEIFRVIRPGGRLVVLETSVPEKFPFRQGYFAYTKFVMPLIGKVFSKDRSAYTYLSKSASAFPYGKKFKTILEKIGFANTKYYPKTLGGVATIYVGNKSK
ncbi:MULTISPECIES: bifunctional demethylmenaquinone methyltransferase/2-methoxy-6-polyprenyl-1,4-benzoquinol methylase UbiE [Capnocytophaga]|uniref:Demethylmenaquinone methyltransferase n=1 Tax=Capnocytophaga canis TaxID=1848903 RepID=A0A0B7I3E1_9FLAO|nr:MULTISPECIES: bifunctional demethylmenaquinone methyltransferase/2-methoxy-6-polyprenyl-1,4-benzoquinol methylase UbiE [Capnocytophaga]ATA73275.1 class I SAM-dependent methyltransferase [Capnocytophaga sp. H4358]ATA75423.1 class I SAM-dependent methyltransferase [Capnocytophaga sp. H2931]RIY38197.1 bifunctional demethylmenaquinone methyltransferase/2-methoxy-6-polyprenyl-1,4-benzoquinol methylase UbiE [Capnocytophaga canis]CEN44338.1 Demethylmenaquinone methyltransferase [Capnocytophaga cani